MNNPGVINTVATMDYVFCPITADRVVAESSLGFASVVNDSFMSMGKGNLKGLYMLWNMVDGREKTNLYDVYEKVAESEEDGVRSIFRSTVMPPDKSLIKGSNIESLADEMLKIING